MRVGGVGQHGGLDGFGVDVEHGEALGQQRAPLAGVVAGRVATLVRAAGECEVAFELVLLAAASLLGRLRVGRLLGQPGAFLGDELAELVELGAAGLQVLAGGPLVGRVRVGVELGAQPGQVAGVVVQFLRG